MEGHSSIKIIVTSVTIIIIILSLLCPPSFSLSDSLSAGESISGSETLVSTDDNFVLGFFTPGNSKRWYLGIWYKRVPGQVIIWVANRETPITGPLRKLSLTNNGNLMVTNGSSEIAWSTGVGNLTNPVARITENGNFIVMDRNISEHTYHWQSFDHPTDTLMPDMKMMVNLRTGASTSLISWRSNDDPSPGMYSLRIDIQGVPQLILYKGSSPNWRMGPWIGNHWSATPDLVQITQLNFSFFTTKDEAWHMFQIAQGFKFLPSLVVNGSSGQIVLRIISKPWNTSYSLPGDKCSIYKQCGAYSQCISNGTNEEPNCTCMEGFGLRASTSSRDCARKVPLDCRGGTDTFRKMASMKLPDTRVAVKLDNMELQECGRTCTANCSCTAYSNLSYDGRRGCLMWFGDLVDLSTQSQGSDVYVRVALRNIQSSSPLGNLSNPKKKSSTAHIVIAVCVVVGTILLTGLGFIFWKRKKSRNAEVYIGRGNERENQDLDLPMLEFDALAAATNNFSPQNKLGEGGFGPVFKGTLGNGQDVAVKRLSKCSTQGIKEFKNEVLVIAKLQHRNLVRLVGCCIHGDERMLIYEYMSNKSLDGFLFGKAKGEGLDWQIRFRIITGIARGLLYLHQDSRLRIIHRDLKASNVLLDKDMNPKISDFGTARIFGGDETEASNTLRVVGTYGYMSPEYALDGIFSVKSDVFSFGVLLLEIVSGTKNRAIFQANPQENLIGHAWQLWNEDKGVELIDSSMARPFDQAEVLKCIKIGLLCVQEQPDDRPSMSSVVHILGGDIQLTPEPKQPGYVSIRAPLELHTSSSANAMSSSINEVSLTMLDGR